MDTTIDTTAAPAAAAPAAVAPRRRARIRSYWLEAKYEFVRLLRTPMFAIPTIAFPALFYLLFGVALGSRGDGQAAQYLLATYGVFGVMGAALFGFGVSIAVERTQGLLALKRALPMPPGAYLLAKMAMAMLFSMLVSLLLLLLAASLGGVVLDPWQWALLPAIHVAGALPFCAMGLYLGTRVSANAAPVVVNLLYLPMAFLSGLWLPLRVLPDALAAAAPVWPAYHHAQLALKVVGMDAGGSIALHVLALVAFTAVFFGLARARLVRRG